MQTPGEVTYILPFVRNAQIACSFGAATRIPMNLHFLVNYTSSPWHKLRCMLVEPTRLSFRCGYHYGGGCTKAITIRRELKLLFMNSDNIRFCAFFKSNFAFFKANFALFEVKFCPFWNRILPFETKFNCNRVCSYVNKIILLLMSHNCNT